MCVCRDRCGVAACGSLIMHIYICPQESPVEGYIIPFVSDVSSTTQVSRAEMGQLMSVAQLTVSRRVMCMWDKHVRQGTHVTSCLMGM